MFVCGTLIASKGIIGGAAPGGFGDSAAGLEGAGPSPIPSHGGPRAPGYKGDPRGHQFKTRHSSRRQGSPAQTRVPKLCVREGPGSCFSSLSPDLSQHALGAHVGDLLRPC